MAIESRPMGGVKLTGDDALAFSKWVETSKQSPIAVETAKRGALLAGEFRKTGCVRIILPPARFPPHPKSEAEK